MDHCLAQQFNICILIVVVRFGVSEGTVCYEKDLMRNLYVNKPGYKEKIDSMDFERPGTPRSVLEALRHCTEYIGNIVIRDSSADDLGFNESVREKDFWNLRNLHVINGYINMYLNNYPGITSFSFLSSLRSVHSKVQGLNLFRSKFEMIGLSNVLRLNVGHVAIGQNKRLCYLENFKTINSSIEFTISHNKDPEICKREGKVCSKACLPGTGCWGPKENQCFKCRYVAEGACTNRCELRKAFFTPRVGRLCGRCHSGCMYGCVGSGEDQCLPRPAPSAFCPKHEFFDDDAKQCRECSRTCFGNSFEKRHRLTVRACTGPNGCSVKCHGSYFLTISSSGQLQCSPCHKDCLSCWSASQSGCLQPKEENQEKTNAALIGSGVALCFVMILLGVGLTFGILAARKKLRNRRKRKFIIKHLRSGSGSSSVLKAMMKFSNRGDSDKESSEDEESSQPLDSNRPSQYIFISYEPENVGIVKEIRAHLQENGFSCLMNEESAEGAELNSSKVVLACVTREFLASDDRRTEIQRADELRKDPNSPVSAIFSIVLGNVNWPPRSEEEPLNGILTESFKMRKEEVGEWLSDSARRLMDQLRTLVGVSLYILYDNDLFTPITSRPEFQSKKENSKSYKFSQMKCHIPSIAAGWCCFKDLHAALSALFDGVRIRSMDQVRGAVEARKVAQATSRGEDKLKNKTTQNVYCDIAGREFTFEQAGMPLKPQKIRAGGRAFLCGGGRRTALRIHPV